MKNTTLCYIEKDGCYLMLHRVKKKVDVNKGKWIGFGGHFEEGESPDECVVREVREETGLTLTSYRYRGIVTFCADNAETELMHLFTADAYEGELADDCNEGIMAWQPKEILPTLPMWEGDYVFLELLRRDIPFFSLKLLYVHDRLTEAVLNGQRLPSVMDFLHEDHAPLPQHDSPLLEFDPCTTAVLNPDHEKLDLHLPEKCVFAFLGDVIDNYAQSHGARRVGTFTSMTRDYPIYVVEHNGQSLCLCRAPVGAAPAAQLMDWLIGYGVKKIISAGSCGTLEEIAEGTFLIPTRALRDEGTSYHYAPPDRFIDLNPAATDILLQILTKHGLKTRTVTTWTTDGFYRETPAKVARRRSEGCSVVEMECAALAACAQLRDVTWGMLLYTADTLADAEHYDERSWGGNADECALQLCLDAAIDL